jgi:hypothetical protein
MSPRRLSAQEERHSVLRVQAKQIHVASDGEPGGGIRPQQFLLLPQLRDMEAREARIRFRYRPACMVPECEHLIRGRAPVWILSSSTGFSMACRPTPA